MGKKKKIEKMQSDKIIKKYREMFKILEDYDKTRELPFQRKKIYLTLPIRTINKLKQLRQKTGKPISRIVEEYVR